MKKARGLDFTHFEAFLKLLKLIFVYAVSMYVQLVMLIGNHTHSLSF